MSFEYPRIFSWYTFDQSTGMPQIYPPILRILIQTVILHKFLMHTHSWQIFLIISLKKPLKIIVSASQHYTHSEIFILTVQSTTLFPKKQHLQTSQNNLQTASFAQVTSFAETYGNIKLEI